MDISGLSLEDQEKLRNCLKSKWWRLNNLYCIKNKYGKKVRFRLNSEQASFHKSKHNLNLIVKARQRGFTTYACIDALDDVLFTSNFEAGIIAHTLDDANKIFENKIKFAFNYLPEWLREERKPKTDRAGELRFPNGSVISVDTSFRSGTVQKLHVSEYGKICKKYPEKAKEIKSGAFEAVALGNQITVESTAEGMSGDLFDMAMRAQSNVGNKLTALDFKLHFYSWHESKDYRLDPDGVEISSTLKEYFRYLEKDHGIKLDDWQKAWYAKKSENQELMHQEYPSYLEEAFMASGRSVWNNQEVAKRIKRAKERKYEIKYFTVKGLNKANKEEEFLIPVKIFVSPKEKEPYAVAGDPAEGLEDGDNSALSVLSRSMVQVASYAGKLDPDIFGGLMVEVAKYFNNAIVAPEANNHGYAVISAIKRRGYFKFFKREVKEETGKEIQDKVGWLSTVKSKMELIDDLKEAFRDESLEINDEDTLREMMTCVIEEDGNIILNGKDRVVALGISVQAIKQAVLDGEYKAFIPGKMPDRDTTKMPIDEKIKYLNRMASR